MKMKDLTKKVTALALTLALSVSLLSGCGKEEKKVLTIAYAPNESTEESAGARSALKEDLEKKFGITVEEIQASDYNAIVEALRTGKADLAYIGALAIALASDRAGAEPIVMKATDGDKNQATYKSLLVTSGSNTDINSIQDIKGKTIAYVDPESTSGNLFPTYEIIKAFPDEELTSDILHTNGKFFEAASFSGKHQAGLQAVVKGDVDVVPVSDQILASEIANGNIQEADIKIINESEPIPAEGFVVRKDLDKDMKVKLQEFLMEYDNQDYFELVIKQPTARFIEASIADYQIVIDLNKTLNTEE